MAPEIDWKAVYDSIKRQRAELDKQYQADKSVLDSALLHAERMLTTGIGDLRLSTETAPASGQPSGPYANMEFIEAAVEVLRAVGRPLTAQEISDRVKAGGKEHTLGSARTLLAKVSRRGDRPFVRLDGKIGLTEWRLPRAIDGAFSTGHSQPAEHSPDAAQESEEQP